MRGRQILLIQYRKGVGFMEGLVEWHGKPAQQTVEHCRIRKQKMINPEMQLVEDLDRVEVKAMRDGYGEVLLELGKDERMWSSGGFDGEY